MGEVLQGLFGELGCSVGAAVVDDDNFRVVAGGLEKRDDFLQACGKPIFLIERGNND